MKVSGKYLIEHGGVDTVPGYEIDPNKEYWYDAVSGKVHAPPSPVQRVWSYMPWVRWSNRRRWRNLEHERRKIMEWEFRHLPEDFAELQGRTPLSDLTFGRCLQIVTPQDLFSDDALYLEMAADTTLAPSPSRATTRL